MSDILINAGLVTSVSQFGMKGLVTLVTQF
jgi:hypothetical protein